MNSSYSSNNANNSNIKRLFKDASQAHEAGDLTKAQTLCEVLLMQVPNDPDGLNLKGIIACQLGDPAAGIVLIARASAEMPNNPSYLNNLGTGLSALGRDHNAILTYQRVLELDPSHAMAHNNLATICRRIGQLDVAANHYQKAIFLNPNYVEAMSNYGNTLLDMGALIRASDVLVKAVSLNPKYAPAQNNLGILRQRQGRYEDAQNIFQTAIQIDPEFADPYVNLAEVYKETGRAEEAVAVYKKSLQLAPDLPSIHSNYLYALNNVYTLSDESIYKAHRQWDQRYATQPLPQPPRAKTKASTLKVGYVSPDFRRHSVSYFLMPIFANHDPQKIEVTCYSNGLIEDEVTEKLKGFVPQWRSIFGMSDADAARLIQKDEIDILVDLSGHTSGNRLPLFTLKPAPIQTSYLGYPTTTGLSAMDYRITDAWADPIGASDQMHTEKLIRLDGGFLCYQPPDDAPNVGPAPCLENEYITFGSCNNLAKLTPQVIKVWARILQAVPHTKLLLKAKALGDKAVRDRLINAFTNESIDKERLILRSWITKKSPLSIYNEIDIALDPFPYNGTTTLCETLWMGVPTIVLEGRRHSARVGHSLNSQVGLQGWTAPDIDGYVTLATLRANDVSNLRRIRESVRDWMKNSSLCDGLAFTERLELAYAKMCKN